MPADAPAIKIDNTRALGAEVVLYDRRRESREEISAKLATEKGAIVVPSFDDPAIIAGQGTVGLEIARQARGAGAEGRCRSAHLQRKGLRPQPANPPRPAWSGGMKFQAGGKISLAKNLDRERYF